MMQLWLDGQRIDSVPLLRCFLDKHQSNEKALIRVLCELIRKYQSGQLSLWLARQSEAQAQSALVMAMSEEKSRLPLLLKQSDVVDGEVLQALAELCAQEKKSWAEYRSHLKKILDEEPLDAMQADSDKQRLVQNQKWYHGMHKLFEHIDWNNVATNSESLMAILERIQTERHSGQTAVYLCDTGRNYRINQPTSLSGLRLIGCGNPSVYFASHNRGKTLNMKKQNLSFEGFVLYPQGMILAGSDRLTDIVVR